MYSSVFYLNMRQSDKATTIRLTPRTLKRLDALAKAMNRTRTWVMQQAVEGYLDYNEWFVRQVEEGLADVKAGRVVPHEEVVEMVKRWEAKADAPLGRG